jgi:hypothetical protein
VLTRAESRGARPTGGTQFLDEMQLVPRTPTRAPLVLTVAREVASTSPSDFR